MLRIQSLWLGACLRYGGGIISEAGDLVIRTRRKQERMWGEKLMQQGPCFQHIIPYLLLSFSVYNPLIKNDLVQKTEVPFMEKCRYCTGYLSYKAQAQIFRKRFKCQICGTSVSHEHHPQITHSHPRVGKSLSCPRAQEPSGVSLLL